MPTSNGLITAPVSIEDVSKTLGIASNDIGTLCTSDKVNRWAVHRPNSDTKVTEITESDINTSFAGNTVYPIRDWDEFYMWGDAYKRNGIKTFRLIDFDKYNHKSVAPIIVDNNPIIALDNKDNTDYYYFSDFIMIGGDYNDTNSMNYLMNLRYGNFYIGIKIWDKRDNSEEQSLTYFYSSSEPIGNLMDGEFFSFLIPASDINPLDKNFTLIAFFAHNGERVDGSHKLEGRELYGLPYYMDNFQGIIYPSRLVIKDYEFIISMTKWGDGYGNSYNNMDKYIGQMLTSHGNTNEGYMSLGLDITSVFSTITRGSFYPSLFNIIYYRWKNGSLVMNSLSLLGITYWNRGGSRVLIKDGDIQLKIGESVQLVVDLEIGTSQTTTDRSIPIRIEGPEWASDDFGDYDYRDVLNITLNIHFIPPQY